VNASVLAYVGLGSNLDEPSAQLRHAARALAALPSTRLIRVSRLFRTPPWGRVDQPDFINAAAELETELSAAELLRGLQGIERQAGRERIERWGPRVLDLDLLLYADAKIRGDGLQVPHPHLHERAFVLLPLADLVPERDVPGSGRVADLLAAVDCSGIEALG
jgi:2-amino-4-hydroxy-6-hydroxymethyldihydropteridine diphosphokinase